MQRAYPIRRLITDKFNPLEKTNIEVTGGSRPRLYLQYRRTKKRVLIKTYRHTTGEIYSEYLASHLADSIGIKAQSAVIKEIPKHVEQWLKEEAGDSLPEPWIPIAIEVSNIFPNGIQIIYGKDILGDPDRRLTLFAIEEGIVTRFDHAEDLLRAYSDMIVFDALIGNMDRHHENWGICISEKYKREIIQANLFNDTSHLLGERHFTPLFDHGSSLMFELPEIKLQRMLEDHTLIEKYVNKAYGFVLDTDGRKVNIFVALQDYLEKAPHWRDAITASINKVLSVEFSTLCEQIQKMPTKPEIGWTDTRKRVLAIMLEMRYNKLQQLIELGEK